MKISMKCDPNKWTLATYMNDNYICHQYLQFTLLCMRIAELQHYALYGKTSLRLSYIPCVMPNRSM